MILLLSDDVVGYVQAHATIAAVKAGNVALVPAAAVELQKNRRVVGEDLADHALSLSHLKKMFPVLLRVGPVPMKNFLSETIISGADPIILFSASIYATLDF